MLGDSGFGRYELVERLTVRSSNELFVVKVSSEHGFRRHIVLKRLRDDAQSTSFIEDAKLSAKLSHAKIVQTLELGRIEDVPYVAMEYVDGVDLLGLLDEVARTRRTLAPALAAWIAQELLDALDYAHTFVDDGRPLEIIHGHLAPTKVLLGDSGEVKLCDFGVARRFDLANSRDQDFGHLAPEQVMDLPLDPRSDVFSVGVLLAEMLMRKRLFAARNEFDVLLMVRDVRIQRLELGGIDEALVAIVQKALEKKPEDRWQSAAAFRDALDEWLFTKRALGMNQQLAALVGEVRDGIDTWRRTGALTPSFDALPDLTPLGNWARGSISPATIRTVAIPTREAAKGSTEMTLAKPPELQDRIVARGTLDPQTKPEPKPAPKPAPRPPPPDRDAVPRPMAQHDSQRSGAHPRLVARTPTRSPGPIGLGMEDLLPARTPTEPSVVPQQLLTPEQLAKVGQPLPPELVQLERAPDDGGDFQRTSPLRVLFHLMRARASGLLSVTHEDVRKDIYMRDGQLAGVWSNDANDLFGNYLVAQHVLSDGELSMALATMSYYGGKIGDTLVGLGLVDRIDVFRHLTRHARTKVIDICTWTAGRYAWYAGNEDPRESFPLEAEAFPMLGEAAQALRPLTIDAWLTKHRDARIVPVKTQRISHDVFAMPGSGEVFAWIDGNRTLGAIVESHADRARAARILYLFMACDLVRTG